MEWDHCFFWKITTFFVKFHSNFSNGIQTNPENFCTRTDQYGDTLPDAAGGSISRMQMSYFIDYNHHHQHLIAALLVHVLVAEYQHHPHFRPKLPTPLARY
ncbi:uncharacterized protein isoform X2 [Leptinotarsa decemlineata]|uniref:uncharacterized protein isoform X2 n=1 Tax=Leptinotarsa decemlineata TaxID=7539 RepID=UPI003D306DB6